VARPNSGEKVILKPHFLVLDTSHLAGLVRDLTSIDSQKNQRARRYLSVLRASGTLLTFSLHHIEEMFGHENDDMIRRRLEFVAGLEMIAWVRPARERGGVGSVVDLLCHELSAVAEHRTSSLNTIRESVRSTLFQVGRGTELVGPILREFGEIAEHVRSGDQRVKAIAAVAHSSSMVPPHMTVGDFLRQDVPTSLAIEGRLRQRFDAFQQEVVTRSDQRLENPEKVAFDFMAEVSNALGRTVSGTTSTAQAFQRICQESDIDPASIDEGTLLRDFCRIAGMRHKLSVARNVLHETGKSIADLPKDVCLPSQLVQEALFTHRQDVPERVGSEIADRHFAAFAPYCDSLFVDKRTFENSRRAAHSDPAFRELTRSMQKASTYELTLSAVVG